MVDFEKITSISVCNMSGEPLYFVDGIDEETVSLVQRLNGQYDLEFDVSHRSDETNISYETLQEGLYLYIEDVGFFKMRTPSETITPGKLTKHITAHSGDAELDDNNLNIEINMGTKTSQEYLVSYQNSEDEVLVNPLNGIPYDWIVLYNTFPAQLDAFKAWLQSEYTFNENGDAITVSVEDENYATLNAMFTLIPRLKSKLMEYVGHEELADRLDVMTYEEVKDGETKTVEYLMQAYASYDADAHGDTVSVTIRPSLLDRIDELKAYYQRYGKQLSLLDIVCSKTGGNWSVGKVWGLDLETPDYTLANTHYQFEINETICSFLTATLAEKLESVVNFNIQNKTINVTPIDHIGEDTGVTLSYDGLLNQLDLTTDEDTLCTRLDVRGGNDITIEQVNFGDPYVVDIDYKLGVKNSAGQRVYVSDELAEKYGRYKLFREEYARPAYSEMSRTYNKINEDRNELIYRVPRDCVANDWGTFSDEELAEQYNSYSQLLNALLQCYAEDYGIPSGTNPYWTQYSTEELEPWMVVSKDNSGYYPTKEKIQQTMYWWDYYAYHQTLTQINVAISARKSTNDKTGYSYKTLTDEQLREMIDAWETEWSLYGTKEIAAKISAYEKSMQALVDGGGVIRKHMTYARAALTGRFSTNPSASDYCSEETYYHVCHVLATGKLWLSLEESEKSWFLDQAWFESMRNAGVSPYVTESGTIDIYTWNQLTDIERGFYGNIDLNYQYKEYKKIYDYRAEAQEALDDLQTQVDVMQAALDNIQTAREDMAVGLTLEDYICRQLTPIATDGLGVLDAQYLEKIVHCNDLLATFSNACGTCHLVAQESFTSNEAKTIHLLYRDAEYTNENILTTTLNDTIDTVDILEELYQDACEQVSIVSRPQINFEVDSDNIFAVEELGPFWEQFELGNYFYVEYKDGTFVKVRMVEYGYNPFIPSGGMTLKFSTMVRSKTKVTDLESVLGMSSSSQISSFGGGGSSSSGQGGAYGTNLNVAISDTMLGKLLGMGSGTTLSNALTSFMVEPSASAVRRISEALRREVDSFVNAATAAGFTLLAKQTAKAPIYQGLKDGDTIVSADCLEGGMIRSTERWDNKTSYRDAATKTGLFSTTSSDANYQSESWYNGILDILKLKKPWGDLDASQKAQFATANHPSGDESRYKAFVAAELYDEPVSWFDMNNGMFSYAKGGLTYNTGAAGEVGQMSLNGIIHATGGNIGDVLIGSISDTDLLYNRMYVGSSGLFKVDKNIDDLVTYRFNLRPTSNTDTADLSSITANDTHFTSLSTGDAFLDFKKMTYEKPGNSTPTDTLYTYIGHAGVLMYRNKRSAPDYIGGTYSTIMLNNETGNLYVSGELKADGNLVVPFGDAYVTRGALHCASITGTASSGSTQNVAITANTSVNGALTVSGNVSVNGDMTIPKQKTLTIPGTSKDIVIGDKYGGYYTGNIRCYRIVTEYVNSTSADYAEYFEWKDGNVLHEDRRGRFVAIYGNAIRLAQADDTDILGIVSARPCIIGHDDNGEWHDKYLQDEFGTIIYEEVEVPDAYDKDGRMIAAAHKEMQPVLNPDYDPDREYIPRSERPEWAVVGLVGQIIMLQDGTCYPNDYCKSADEGIATKSDERTNFRVMKRIDDRHILVMVK